MAEGRRGWKIVDDEKCRLAQRTSLRAQQKSGSCGQCFEAVTEQATPLLQLLRPLGLRVRQKADDVEIHRIVKVQILDLSQGRSAPGSSVVAEARFPQVVQQVAAFSLSPRAQNLTRQTSEQACYS